jgi:hypothetical protein
MQHLLLIENSLLESATHRFLVSKLGIETTTIESFPTAIHALTRPENESIILDLFNMVSHWLKAKIQTACDGAGIPRVLVHTDFLGALDLSSLNPIQSIGSDQQNRRGVLLSMLILAFPEVHWVFVRQRVPSDEKYSELLRAAHFYEVKDVRWLKMARAGFTNLFDVTGLRNHVHRNLIASGIDYLPLREKTGAGIDDEHEYADFNAYIGYRFGFRTCGVSSARLMECLFAENGLLIPDLVLEDLYLGFGDREEADKPNLFRDNSILRIRDQHFPNLARSSYRRCITSGHSQGQASNGAAIKRQQLNAEYYGKLLSTGPAEWGEKCRILLKPCSGVFDLWDRSRLSEQVKASYPWPPVATHLGNPSHHSIRERLPMIVDQLITRAEAIMRDEPTSVAMCMYGAVLANEAGDLLGGRAPTTGLRAIALKHEFEVMAECDFFGAAYHLDVQRRINNIRESIQRYAPWFNSDKGPQSLNNIRAGIVNRLLIRFRENNQFDEEQVCLHEIRRTHREISLADSGLVKRGILDVPTRYALFLMSSVQCFFIMVIVWILVFWGGFAALVWDWEWSPVPDWQKIEYVVGKSLEDCFNTFLGFSTISEWKNSVCPPMYLFLSCVAVIWGVFHLGVFIAHIYSYIARK